MSGTRDSSVPMNELIFPLSPLGIILNIMDLDTAIIEPDSRHKSGPDYKCTDFIPAELREELYDRLPMYMAETDFANA